MGVTQAAGLSLKWFRDNFCAAEKTTAEAMGVDTYELTNKEAAQSPIGANKLIYAPYLMGERTPHLDSDCRGIFFGLSAMHKRRDMLRAVMEGVAFSLNDCLGVLAEMGVAPETMLACGGGGKSPLWRQMLADIMKCPVATTVNTEGPALGVAILAGVGAGLYGSVQEACRAMIKVNPKQDPIAENVPKYEKVYAVYQKLYTANKQMFKELGTIE
jgi:xylulokinase